MMRFSPAYKIMAIIGKLRNIAQNRLEHRRFAAIHQEIEERRRLILSSGKVAKPENMAIIHTSTTFVPESIEEKGEGGD